MPEETALAQVSGLPSGQSLILHEVLVDQVGGEEWVRFRFVAPGIARSGGAFGFAEIEADFAHLCTYVALPYLRTYELAPDLVAVTMMDRVVSFGQTDPDATQYVDVFRVVSGDCIWEGL
jgi:hypothetical protein